MRVPQLMFICSMAVTSFAPLLAKAQEDSAATQFVCPDSLRLTVYPGEFKWRKFRYEAEVQIYPYYSPEKKKRDDLQILINIETPGASFWIDDEQRRDVLVLRKNQDQAIGKIRWFSGGEVKLTAQTCNYKTPTKITEVSLPILLWLVILLGGFLGGWMRRMANPSSAVNLRVSLLPEKWSKRVAPFREIAISMVAAFLLYLLNEVSPIYIEFRSAYGPAWLVLVQPLLVGFIGGWGGINLLIGLLDQVLQRGKKTEKDELRAPVAAPKKKSLEIA